MFNEEPEFYEYSNPDEALERFIAPMDTMYDIAIGNKSFSSTLVESDTQYYTSNTGEIIATYSRDGWDFTLYPFDPTNIKKEDIQKMIDHYEEREEYEKCLELIKLIDEDKK